jgi:hypothetical protein
MAAARRMASAVCWRVEARSSAARSITPVEGAPGISMRTRSLLTQSASPQRSSCCMVWRNRARAACLTASRQLQGPVLLAFRREGEAAHCQSMNAITLEADPVPIGLSRPESE